MKGKVIAFLSAASLMAANVAGVGSLAVFAEDATTAASTEITTAATTESTTATTATTESTTAATTESTTAATTESTTTAATEGTTETTTEEYDCTGKYVNIAFVIDATGSMSSYIKTVKNNLTAFVDAIAKSGAIPRISIIEYRDITCKGEDTIVHTTEDYSVWFEDTDAVIGEINAISVSGGGDAPETVIDALGYVADDKTMTFNAYAAKFAFVVTDASYKTNNIWGIKDMDEMIDILNAKGIQTSVVTDKWSSSSYEDLTSKTGGKLINMSSSFSEELISYAKSIIAKTAAVEVDESYVPVTSITLGDDVTIVTDGIYKYPVTVNPAEATVKDIIWSVEDDTKAEINTELTTSEFCVINAKAEGETKLIAKTADGGYTAYFTITIADFVTDKSGTTTTCKIDKASEYLTSEGVTRVSVVATEDKAVIDKSLLEDILKTAKVGSKEIEFTFTDAYGETLYSWTFAGKNIKDETVSVDSFAVESGKTVEAVDTAVKEFDVDAADYSDIHFVHEGALPGTATVSVKTDIDAESLYLYYYNPATGLLELIDSSVSVKDGYATFDIEHCSDYVLSKSELVKSSVSTEEPATEGATETPASDAPRTGDSGFAGVAAALILSAGVLVYAADRKRRAA